MFNFVNNSKLFKAWQVTCGDAGYKLVVVISLGTTNVKADEYVDPVKLLNLTQKLNLKFNSSQDSPMLSVDSRRIYHHGLDHFVLMSSEDKIVEDLKTLKEFQKAEKITFHIGYDDKTLEEPVESLRSSYDAWLAAKRLKATEAIKNSSFFRRDEIEDAMNGNHRNENYFFLNFQKKITLREFKQKTIETNHVEALTRLKFGNSIIYPESNKKDDISFLSSIKAHGLSFQFNRWLVRSTLEYLRCKTHVSINIYASDLNAQFLELISCTIADKDILSYLEIEILEHDALDVGSDSENTKTIAALRELGVQFSIDDFGKGFSNIGLLGNFDRIKIDKSFVIQCGGVAAPRKYSNILNSILMLLKAHDAYIILEGVDDGVKGIITDLINDSDISQDKVMFQGYGIHKPSLFTEIENTLIYMKPAAFSSESLTIN